MTFGGVHVALDFAQRDRTRGQLAVGVKHGIPRVFPALVGEAGFALGPVLDETVAITVSVFVDPAKRRLDVGPQLGDRVEVAGALKVHTGENDEQRRAVDGAVIKAERHLAQPRHFAVAGFVQDFSRLGVRLGPHLGGLVGGEELEHASGNARIDP